jgi:membrane protein DedA with SNARE-associated domain
MEQLAEWLVSLIDTVGYPGVFIAMFMGNALVPIPVEVVMIPAGYLVQQKIMHFPLLMMSAIAGDVGGSLFGYYIAYHFGRQVLLKYGKYLLLNDKKMGMLETFFAHHGEISTLTGRLVPGLRHFMAFPAGLSHMNVKKFAAYTGIGGGIWMGILVLLGYFIGGNKHLVKHYLPYITGAVIGAVSVMIVVYILHRRGWKIEDNSHDGT